MMKSAIKPAAMIGMFAILALVDRGYGQEISNPLSSLRSDTDSARMKGFYGLLANANRGQPPRPAGGLRPRTDLLAAQASREPALKSGLIELLERENALMAKRSAGSASELDLLDYRLDVVAVVAQLNEQRALPALLPWINTGGAAQAAIVEFGEASVPHLISMLDDRDRHNRSAAARSIKELLHHRGRLALSGKAVAAIREALLRAVRNQEDWVLRRNVVQALMNFGDNDVRTEMERLVMRDTATLPGAGDTPRYPVREAARAWLNAHRPHPQS